MGEGRQGCSPILDQSYDLGVGLPNDTLPIHLHQPVSCAKARPMGGAIILHVLDKDGVHGLQAVPGGGSC